MGCFGLSYSPGVLFGNGITQFLEVAAAQFGIVTRGIRWEIRVITVFGKEVAMGNVGFFG